MRVEETNQLQSLFEELCEEIIGKLCSAAKIIYGKNKTVYGKDAVSYVCLASSIPLAIAFMPFRLVPFVVAAIVGMTIAMVEDAVTQRSAYDKSLSKLVEAMCAWRAHYEDFLGDLEVFRPERLKQRVNDILGLYLKEDIEVNLINLEDVCKKFQMVEKLLKELALMKCALENAEFQQETWDTNVPEETESYETNNDDEELSHLLC